MRPKEFDPDAVTDAAMRIFWQKGYTGASVQDLVEATGLGRGSLYNAFESKHRLFELALTRYFAVTSANIALLQRDDSAKVLLRTLLTSIADDELYDQTRRGCLAANASLEVAGHDPRVAHLIAENYTRFELALTHTIQRGMDSGEIISPFTAEALAITFLNAIQGMRVVSKGSHADKRAKRLNDIIQVTMSLCG